MRSGELIKIAALGALFLVLALINRFDLLAPAGREAFAAQGQSLMERYRVWAFSCALLVVLIPCSVVALQIVLRSRLEKRIADGPSEILLPRSDWKPIDPSKVELWSRLADALPRDEYLSFELAGNDVDNYFLAHASTEGLKAAIIQIRAEWKGTQKRPIERNDDPAILPEGWFIWFCELTPSTWRKPILAISDDPLRGLLIELNGVSGDGRGMVQVIAKRDFGTRKKLGRAAFTARDAQIDSKGVQAVRRQDARIYEERAQKTFLQATVRTVGLADTKDRAQGIARGLARTVAASFSSSNPVRRIKEGQDASKVLKRGMGRKGIWAADELAYLGHLIGSDMLMLAPRLRTAMAKQLPADPEMRVSVADATAVFAEA
jgi:hypothetical protein